ncbi:MAG: hypothetical protein VX737_04390 [Pseudomonadota bacterium]|nr:hypothetical protein [Pseudomonadota bacterium]
MSKLKILCIAAACALSATAASPLKKIPAKAPGWGIGFVANTDTQYNSGSLQLDYKASNWEHGFTLSGSMCDFDDKITVTNRLTNDEVVREDVSWNQFGFGHYIGLRKMLKPQLALSSGLSTDILMVDRWSEYKGGIGLERTPYNIGFYTQLSFEPLDYVSVFARTKVWSYENLGLKETGDVATAGANIVKIFGDMAVGVSYYWQA